MTIHSSQGLTIEDPRKVWLMNDHLKWSNLVYLAVSRVEYLRQIEQVWIPRQLTVKSEGKYEELFPLLVAKYGHGWSERFKKGEELIPSDRWKHLTSEHKKEGDNVFDSIFRNDKKPGRAVEGQFTADQLQNLVVVRDEKARLFVTFFGRGEFWDWYRDLSEKHIHEVIFGNKLQRIKFDLDITLKDRADAKMEAMLDNFLNVVFDEFHVCYADTHVTLERDDIILMDSSGPITSGWNEKGYIQIGYKHSYHVILTQYCVANNEEAQYFAARVIDRLDPEIGQYVDPQVNKRVQNFRIAESQKLGVYRDKVLNSEMSKTLRARYTILEESLVEATNEIELPRRLEATPIKTDRRDVNAALRLAQKILRLDDGGEGPARRYTGVSGGLLLFKRERPLYCRLCDRTHDNDNTLMITIKDGIATERCRRVRGGRVLGKVWTKKIDDEKRIKTTIRKKLVSYKRQDSTKKRTFGLDVDHVLELKRAQENHCAACNIEMLWIFRPGDTEKFSIDRIDNKEGHDRYNVRLTCLVCNRNRGAAKLKEDSSVEQQEATHEQIPASAYY